MTLPRRSLPHCSMLVIAVAFLAGCGGTTNEEPGTPKEQTMSEGDARNIIASNA